MALSLPFFNTVDKALANNINVSVTAVTGDWIFFACSWKVSGAADFPSVTWNGQSLPVIAYADGRDHKTRIFAAQATASTTANVIGSSSVFTQLNCAYFVVRSSTLQLTSAAVKSSQVFASDIEAYTSPSFTVNLASNEYVLDFLSWLGWDSAYTNVTTTTAAPTSANLTQDSVVQNSSQATGGGRLYIGHSSGLTGSQSIGWTKSGTGNPMYNHIAIVVTESVYVINSLTDPLVSGGAFSGTTTGFADGAATLSFGGISIPVTISSNTFSGTVTALTDNIVYPFLPASNLTVTLTQGANSATLTRSLSLPVGYEVTRDITTNNPSNFSGLVTGDSTYIQDAFIAAGNALTTNDRAVFSTADGLKIYPDGKLEINSAVLPKDVTIFIQRGSDGKVYEHVLQIDVNGEVTGVISKGIAIGYGIGISI